MLRSVAAMRPSYGCGYTSRIYLLAKVKWGVSRLRAHSSGHAYMYVPKYTYLRLP
jgi:hypothetical protein